MKEYIPLNSNEIMDREQAIEWLEENLSIKFEFTIDNKKLEKQIELQESLLEQFFIIQEARERVYFDELAGVQVIDLTI